MTIKKGTIELRLVQLEHLEILFDWENRPDHMQFSTSKGPYSKAYVRQFIVESQDIVGDRQIRLMIYKPDFMAQPIGLIDIYNYEAKEQIATIGILIANKSMKRKGIGTEAMLAAIEYCFSYLPIERLTCSIHSSNTKSIGLFEKCGFELINEHSNFKAYELRNQV